MPNFLYERKSKKPQRFFLQPEKSQWMCQSLYGVVSKQRLKCRNNHTNSCSSFNECWRYLKMTSQHFWWTGMLCRKKKERHFEERGWRLGRVPVRTYFRWKISVQLLHDGSGSPETWPILYCIIIAVSGSTVWWNWSSDGDTYEPQKEWFGNKDVSVHEVMFLYREEEEGLLLTEYHDTFSATNVLFCFVLFF